MRLSDDEMIDKLLTQPALLRLPLVRFGSRLSVGNDEPAWREWMTAER
jgi:arsenate reductase-like glutaredoxin family protein